MPELIERASVIPVPGGKLIEEYVGRVVNGESQVSVAHMTAPAGWDEPAQVPDFDEITLVLDGSVQVHTDQGVITVSQGQAIVTRAGERIRYACPNGARYVAICLPAFSPELVNREG